VESNANPLQAFLAVHPGAAWTIAKGVGIGASVGIGIGLALPGWGAWYRAAVTLLFALGCALIGGLIAGAIAIPRRRRIEPLKADWAVKVDTKMKSRTSNPVPRRVSLRQDGDG
jgi:Flp pilus assembly protein protease CpaA